MELGDPDCRHKATITYRLRRRIVLGYREKLPGIRQVSRDRKFSVGTRAVLGLGNRSSCDGGDNHQSTAPVKTPQRSFSVRRVGSVRRRASPFHARREITDQNGGAASAPTSPHFGIGMTTTSSSYEEV